MATDAECLGEITVYLKRLSSGDSSAEDPLAELVYVHLQKMARRLVHAKAPDFTLEATSLVNHVLLELVRLRSIDWADRVHFFRVAARLLRRRLIDRIRRERASKRPPVAARLTLEDLILPAEERFEEVLLVHEGLEQLASFDPELAELVELVYFGGIPISSIAEMRGVSEKTVDRHLDLARRWMAARFRIKCPQLAARAASSSKS